MSAAQGRSQTGPHRSAQNEGTLMTIDDFLARHRQQWSSQWQAITGQPGDPVLRDALLARYSESHRHYHTLEHLDACLRHCVLLCTGADHPHEVTLALWFHDAIYDIGAPDNELRSADWARDALQQAGAAAAPVQRVHDLIMATRHDVAPQSRDQEILLDADLAILGAPSTVFDAYEQQIHAEYHAVPQATRRVTRRRILQGFLDRPRIYHTALFHQQREAQARANLARSVAALASG